MGNFKMQAVGEYSISPTLIIYHVPEEYPQEGEPLFNLSVNGKYTGIYTDIGEWGQLVSFGYFDFDPKREVEIELTVAFDFQQYRILPESARIKSTRKGNTIKLKTRTADRALSFVFDDNYKGSVFHLFINSIDRDAPVASDDNTIYFGPGYHDLGVSNGGRLVISGNKRLYIAGGAVVNGTVVIEKGEQTVVAGHGLLMKTAPNDLVLIANQSDNISIKGIIVCSHRNPGWTVGFDSSSNVEVDNVKIVSARYASTDGFDIVNSNHIHIHNTFIRACDDAIAIKGLKRGNPQDCPPNENMMFEHLQLWNDCNNAICLGAETRAKYYRSLYFKDIDVLFSYDDRDNHEQLDERSVMSIVCLDGTWFGDIRFEDIRVNRCERLICLTFKDSFWFGSILGNQRTEGGINNVVFKNIRVVSNSGSNIANEILLNGWQKDGTPTKTIENITFDNVYIEGQKVDEHSSYLKTNNSPQCQLVTNLSFK
jgi:hypothetical protein